MLYIYIYIGWTDTGKHVIKRIFIYFEIWPKYLQWDWRLAFDHHYIYLRMLHFVGITIITLETKQTVQVHGLRLWNDQIHPIRKAKRLGWGWGQHKYIRKFSGLASMTTEFVALQLHMRSKVMILLVIIQVIMRCLYLTWCSCLSSIFLYNTWLTLSYGRDFTGIIMVVLPPNI